MTGDILIVDDEPAVRELLKLVIRTTNMPFREAQDGIDALEKIEADLRFFATLRMSMFMAP